MLNKLHAVVLTLMTAALVWMGAVDLAGCSGTATPKQAAQQFIDCSKANIGQAVSKDGPALFEVVLQLVMGGSPDWQSSLEAVGQTFGISELACAVQAVESLLVAHADGTPATAGLTPQAARALAFLAAHPEWKFVAPSAK